MQTFMATSTFQYTTDEANASYRFITVDEYANGSRVHVEKRNEQRWVLDYDLTVHNLTLTRQLILDTYRKKRPSDEYGYVGQHTHQMTY